MTVRENLQMGAYTKRDSLKETMQEVFELFPILEERSDQRVESMSGGQQQMLAIGRGLMARPKILALDEPSEGLAPQITDRVFEKIEAISEDVTVLLVEQHVNRALKLADRAYLLENGRIVREDTGRGLLESEHVKEAYL
jgi:branched-chain amino acid transport system ATP-binding protein